MTDKDYVIKFKNGSELRIKAGGKGWTKFQGAAMSMIWSDCDACGEAAVLIVGPVDDLHRCEAPE